ncbi:hypothetical protein BH10CHL1_BH10CHL1_18770 [soil metagenome]
MSSLPHDFRLSTPSSDLVEPPSSSVSAHFHLVSYLLGLLTSLILVGGVVFFLRRPDPPAIVLHPPPPPMPTATALPPPTPASIMVFVSGAVQKPGLYNLSADERVGDALAKAGGFTATANPSLINQATKLQDGAQVYVPDLTAQTTVQQPAAGVSEPVAQSGSDPSSNAQIGPINLNTATAEQLDSLPGIGPSKAAAIVANRPYATVDELDKVPGIGPSILEQVRPLVSAP